MPHMLGKRIGKIKLDINKMNKVYCINCKYYNSWSAGVEPDGNYAWDAGEECINKNCHVSSNKNNNCKYYKDSIRYRFKNFCRKC